MLKKVLRILLSLFRNNNQSTVKNNASVIDIISALIVIVCLLSIGMILFLEKPPSGYTSYTVVSLIGSIASTGGLIIAILQIVSLKNATEATRKAIVKTEIELSIMQAIESASNCFNQLNQIDEYLENMNIDSIKTLLPIATQNFHDLIAFPDHNLEHLLKSSDELSDFLESFASKLTVMANRKNAKGIAYFLEDQDLNNISLALQRTKAFADKYRNILQQAIVK